MIREETNGSLPRKRKVGSRMVKAIHGVREFESDPQFELDMANHLREQLGREQLLEAFSRHAIGASYIDELMRRVCLRALVRKLGASADIRRGVSVIHPETFEIDDGVFIGEQTIIQIGRAHV